MWNRVIKFLFQEIDINTTYKDTRDEAKLRLKQVILSDRNKLAPGIMEKMKADIGEVLSRYIEIDANSIDLHLENKHDKLSLIANISVISTTAKKVATT